MRYAILSDIHGNLEALTAVLASLATERIDRYLCLGDVVGYGADPVACLERLHGVDAVMVAGNHEWGCLGKLDEGWFNDAARIALGWTRARLGVGERERLRQLPLTTTDGPCTLVHGTLRQPEQFDYLMDSAEALETLKSCRTQFCLVGHTHVPCMIEYDRDTHALVRMVTGRDALADVRYQDAPERVRYLANPGSVGQPRDGDRQASVALLDTATRTFSVRRVAYDVATAARKIREAGLPSFLAERLAVGR